VIDCAALLAVALGVGVLSALLPVVNAEVFLLAATATVSPWVGVGAVVGLSVGQVAGKVVLFGASRRSRTTVAGRRERRRAARPPREPRWPRVKAWGERSLGMLDRRGPAAGVLLASAAVGVPPLAVTTVAAGARRTPASLFVACALTGRLARFAVLAAPVVATTA
jgi:membrane protein YqaA with SNARE-associated domain